jgi:hypothetical protein
LKSKDPYHSTLASSLISQAETLLPLVYFLTKTVHKGFEGGEPGALPLLLALFRFPGPPEIVIKKD